MFTQIGIAIKQFFVAVTVLFSAFESSANAIKSLTEFGEETAAAFADNARVNRAKQRAIEQAELKAVELKAAA